ncbi:MAG: glycoside hydrolase family 9 protein [Methylococcales bacterium]|nr:glycoside hydrolase family 9 protein [Methylococcales bacterium]
MRLFISISFLFLIGVNQVNASEIVINQVGYLPNWPKVALWVNSDTTKKQIELIDTATKKSVYTFRAARKHKDAQTGDYIQELDFSSYNKKGRYLLRAGNIKSLPFAIGNDVYKSSLRLLLRSYYLQRCGIAIFDAETGLNHASCHLHDGLVKHADGFHKENDVIHSIGGWHDAGDNGKYVATTAITVGRILALYEEHPALFTDFLLDIPESSSDLPDVLDEMKVGLDWMLSMQRLDGAVYRKLSGESWPVDLAPDQDKQPRYIYGVTSPETAKAAAAWAMAARIYKSSQPELAARYLKAARKSWDYLQTIDEQVFEFQEGDNKGSGPYMYNETDDDISLTYDWDDRLWAAMELLITTGEKPFQKYVNKKLPDAPLAFFEWKNPSGMAFSHALFHPALPTKREWHQGAKKKVMARAKILLNNIAASGYRIANSRFVWGSNKMTVEEGIILISAYRLSQDTAYLDAAIYQLDYIFGSNHFNMSFVTGVGKNPAKAISHLYLSAAKTKLAGLLVGGPNILAQAKIAPKNKGPLSYIDDPRSYATNEYAIDYNASLIALIGMLISTPYPDNH